LIKAVIFDLDGVVTDTSELHYKAWKRIANAEGLRFDREIAQKLRGVSRSESLRKIIDYNKKDLTIEESRRLVDAKNKYYKSLLEKLTEKDYLPGIKEFILELKKRSIKTAIASASKNAKTVISKLKGQTLFDYIADGNSVSRSKPDPAIFLLVAKKLGVSPCDCAVVEDSEAGVKAAIAAGMIAIAIGPLTRFPTFHLRYGNTSQLNIDELLLLGIATVFLQ